MAVLTGPHPLPSVTSKLIAHMFIEFFFQTEQKFQGKNKPGFSGVWRQKLSWGHHNALPQGSKFVSASAQCLLVLSPFREICQGRALFP